MHEARTQKGKVYRFRSLRALTRRLGGNGWRLLDGPRNSDERKIMVVKHDRRGKRHVLDVLTMSREAFNNASH